MAQIPEFIDPETLCGWVGKQRWYASKSRSIAGIEVIEALTLREDPKLLLALVQTRFATGTHELYQLLITVDEHGDPVYDALVDPLVALELMRRIEVSEDIGTDEGRFSFRHVDGVSGITADASARPAGVEQSNSSFVLDERLMLKVFRKVEPGINPELEVLRFLTSHGFEHIASLQGWYEYEGHALAATLGVSQTFLPDASDGWELALDRIQSDSDSLVDLLGDLGAVTANMHSVLACDAGDPAFSPEEPSQEAISLLTATIDEDIERIFLRLPEDDQRLDPIAGRGQDVRERVHKRAQIGIGGLVIRTHGDYHLGQTLHTPRGWVIIDFEGEPARPLPQRRAKRSPLRDVASMLRSFAYVSSAVELLRGGHASENFEQRARDRFLERYFAEIDSTLLPIGDAQVMSLLSIFELEKAIYELRYELDNRPDWVSIPVAGIRRLLESE
ncbi:MAG: maltokinase N-terminal cap-like domain-containing protein [Solirubrobacteraceae bacterium]